MIPACEVCALEESQYDLEQVLLEKFHVAVCTSCMRSHPDLYSLIPKTTAKAEFLLTEEELADQSVLPHITKPNPKSPRWSNMQLYLRKHVIHFSTTKWGSMERLEEEKRNKSLRASSFKVHRFENKVKDLRKKTRLENSIQKYKPLSSTRHTHSFILSDAEGIKKCKECGFKIKYEVI